MDKIHAILKENEALKARILEQENEVRKLQEAIFQIEQETKVLNDTLSEKDTEIQLLKESITLMRAKKFGSSSEKTSVDQLALEFFDEAEKAADLHVSEPTMAKVITRKKRTSRKEKIQDLETEVIHYDLPESEQVCPECQTPLKKIHEESRETIKLYKSLIRLIEKRAVYACPNCDYITKAAMPKLPIEGSIASPSALAQVIVDKYANSIPLYRQSDDFARFSLDLSRQTLANWILKSSDLLDWVYQGMKQELLRQSILHADETTLQVLKESGRPATSKSYMWLYQTSRYDTPVVIYEYQESRAGKHPKDFLKNFKGYLHVDGYSGYQGLENITLVGCLAHVRRYFHEAFVALGDNAKDSLTEKGLIFCHRLFQLEEESKKLDLKERLEYKIKEIKPVFESFYQWAAELSPQALPKSRLGMAVQYALNQLPQVRNYFLDAKLDIDNNRAERAIKPFVIGRKNWLFSNSVGGAEASARLYSIVQTCILNKINPYAYLTDILDKLANMTINSDTRVDRFLPWDPSIQKQYTLLKA
jgi:transposase